MYPVLHTLTVETDASGDATVYTAEAVHGRVLQLLISNTDLDAGADWAITGETTGVSVLTLTDANSGTYAPRQATHGTDGSASLYAATGEAVEDAVFVAGERIKVVVANGGNATSGTLYLWTG